MNHRERNQSGSFPARRFQDDPTGGEGAAGESSLAACRRQTSELVQSNPATAIVAGLGLGLGLGLLVGCALVRDHGRSRTSFEIAAVSRRVFDQLRAHVPDVVRKYLDA